MIDPYRMIVVNLISSALLLSGVITYKFIYPKKNINLLSLLILISILPLISILREGTYESGDLSLHAGFAMSFYESLTEGNFIPRWSSHLVYGYGYPLFIFAYPLPYYLTAAIHFLGFNFINSLKILLAFSFITSGIGMYFLVKEELRNKYSAFIAALIYLFSPYHLVDLHFRVAIGEMLAFAILPFLFLTIRKVFYKKSFLWFLLATTSFSLIILSHQAISLLSSFFIIVYVLYLFTKKGQENFSRMFFCIFSLITGILLSSFYWLPLIINAKHTGLLTNGTISFVKLSQLIYSPWMYGFLFQGHKGELSLIVGYVQLFIFLFSFIFLFKNTEKIKKILFFIKIKGQFRDKKLYLFSIISFFILLVMTQSISSPVWQNISLLKGFQFSYRLLLFVSFFVSIIAGIVIKNTTNSWFFIIVCLLTISTTILNWGNRKTLPLHTESSIFYQLPRTMSNVGSGVTTWVDSNKFTLKQKTLPHIEILNGQANISEVSRASTKHEYLINITAKNTLIKENTLYFPGWKLYVDNNIHQIDYKNPEHPGIILFDLSPGLHHAKLLFEDTTIMELSKLISFLTGIIIALYALKKYLLDNLINTPKRKIC